VVKIRHQRRGRKKLPIYKVVAADSRSPRNGRFIEAIGVYKPLENPPVIEFNEERAMYWLKVGAQPTDTARSLLSKEGIMLKLHLVRKGKTEADITSELEAWRTAQEAKAGANKKQLRAQKQKEEARIKAEAEAKAKAEAEAAAKAKAEAEAKAKAEAEAAAAAAAETATAAEAEAPTEGQQEG